MIHLEIFAMRTLEIIFLVGMAGSIIVAFLTFVADIQVLFERDRPGTDFARPVQQYSQSAGSPRSDSSAATSRA